MNEGLQKFRELLFTDEAFRQKLKTAIDVYSGDHTQEAIFENVLVPIASEYGISATYEEYAAYMDGVQKEGDSEIDNEELAQLAGGKGFGAVACWSWGIGAGGVSKGQTVCIALGIGYGESACAGPGV